MLGIDDILSLDSERFGEAALEIFRYQAVHCPPYREYIELLGVDPMAVGSVESIPFLPISLFRTHKVYCADHEPQKVFTSSSTGSDVPSRHYVASLEVYRRCFEASYLSFYEPMPVYALLPCYLQRTGSSLVYMADEMIRRWGGGFYLDDMDTLRVDLERDPRPKILLGVSYALLDMAERHPGPLLNTIVMETGGMKGRRREMSKSELHSVLCSAFGVDRIHSEYGMAELMSQAYSQGSGLFRLPPWMRVLIRDISDPFRILPQGRRGGVNVIDLGNIGSCCFLQTDDVGMLLPSGELELLGRVAGSVIRGCNLLVQ